MTDTGFTWTHRDDRGIEATIRAGLERGKNGPWSDDAPSRADFRGLLLGACGALSILGTTPPALVNDATTFRIGGAPRSDELAWQVALARAVGAFNTTEPTTKADGIRLATANGVAGTEPINTAIGWPAAIAVCVCFGIFSTWLYGVVSQENELKATKIATDANQQALAMELARSVEVIEKHKLDEHAAGATKPYDEQEKKILDLLNAQIEKSAGWHPPAMKSIPDVKDITKPIGDAIDKISTGALVFGFALALLYAMKD